MGDKSGIEWTDATWNMLVAFVLDMVNGTYTFDDAPGMKWRRGWFCTHASEGCRNCYAESMNVWRGNGLAYVAQNLPLVRFEFVGLDQPLRWTRPRMIFPCSMTDLFADFYADEQIDKVFAVMALTRQHTYQVLTKRAKRMREYMTHPEREAYWMNAVAAVVEEFGLHNLRPAIIGQREPWIPLPNVWLCVSVENQKAADERVTQLLRTPAAVRGLSVEPLLGPVDLCAAGMKINGKLNVATGEREFIDWVVVGGESGPRARPMHPRWARQVRDDCVTCGVPFFFKQWGQFAPSQPGAGACSHPSSDGAQGPASQLEIVEVWRCGLCNTLHGDGFDFVRVGKKEAGRVLDGRTWDEMPRGHEAR